MNIDIADIDTAKAPIVLILDDEEMVTKTLTAYLELETNYHVVAFQSAKSALDYLKKKTVDLVITDFLMPEMDGLQFLSEAQKIKPDLTSIMLTGYADKENAIKAINEVELFQYVEKPWENEHLRLLIRNALQNKKLREVLTEKIAELDDILLAHEKVLLDNEMIREELLLARSVQHSMLPNRFPDLDNVRFATKYQPALEVGGDFYDIIRLAGGKIGVLIADVTGHGIQAALITVLLKSAFSEWRDRTCRPQEILVALNQLLFRALPKNMYAAGQVLVFDPATGYCLLANAGIPHPLIINGESGDVNPVAANGLLLGITDDTLFQPGDELSFHLQPADKLLLATDGLTEAEGTNDRHFDDVMLDYLQNIATANATGILEHLLTEAKTFSKPDHNWDDITMIAIEILKT